MDKRTNLESAVSRKHGSSSISKNKHFLPLWYTHVRMHISGVTQWELDFKFLGSLYCKWIFEITFHCWFSTFINFNLWWQYVNRYTLSHFRFLECNREVGVTHVWVRENVQIALKILTQFMKPIDVAYFLNWIHRKCCMWTESCNWWRNIRATLILNRNTKIYIGK